MGADRVAGRSTATRSEVLATNGMAATSQPLATSVAIDVLRRGGTAVDAAIAANAVLGLMEPTGCGIGGDIMALVWDPGARLLQGLNGSGRSPQSLTLDYLQQQNISRLPKHGPLTISVPGCVDGWFELHARYGRLPMSELLQPAIDYARNGFPVSQVIADGWRSGVKTLHDYPGFTETFAPDGRAPGEGELFRNPRLANTLEAIARGGREAFYDGDMATVIEESVRQAGGFLTRRDLSQHRSEWVRPVSVNYRGYDVWELPPNGQGIAALQMLKVLEGFDLQTAGFGSFRHLHLLTEAKKLAFEDRARLYADPAFANVPVHRLISKEYAQARRELIDMQRASAKYPADTESLQQGDTIYLTVADKDRQMVSLIQSNYRGFGSGICPHGLGFCLQSRGELFDLTPGRANSYEPGKRPFHTIIPAFVTNDGLPFLSFGVMGGDMQPQGHVQILMNVIDFGMNLQEAGDVPRLHHDGSSEPTGERMTDGGEVHLEHGYDEQVIRELVSAGHKVAFRNGIYGGYQAIGYDVQHDVYHGASDPRKDGHAAGY
ncbi:MAG: gamma-glutamyltransferase [Planctomycetales bacterium]|nr:gamma-glutamyltransferase [Planctomycetales bacterium]